MRVQHDKLGEGIVTKQFEYEGMELAHVEFESGEHVIPLAHLEEVAGGTLQEFLEIGARVIEIMDDIGVLPDDSDSAIMLALALALFTSELAEELGYDD